MRVLRCLAAGVLLAAGIIGAGIAIDVRSGYAAGNSSLVVSPGQGSPDAQFTATYRSPSARGRGHPNTCPTAQITFKWDGSPLGQAAPTRTGNTCVAALHAAPPPGVYRGTSSHTITVSNDASAHARYLVVVRQASTPSSGPPSATPTGTTESAVNPQSAGVAGTPPDTASSSPYAGSQAATSGMTMWVVAFGAVLFLAGAGMFGVITWRRRHPNLGTEAPRALADTDTRPLPLRHRPAHRAARRFDLRRSTTGASRYR
jgi:hypothetical protein